MTMLSANLTSALRSPASWAKVARETIRALVAAGYEVSAQEDDEVAAQSGFALDRDVGDALATRRRPGAVSLDIVRPEAFAKWRADDPQIGFMVYEADRWPAEWVEAAHGADFILTPSTFCREGLLASGLSADQVAVWPHGIDPEVYYPVSRSSRGGRTRLLFVGTPSSRKGLDTLLWALPLAFGPQEVALTVKTARWPPRSDRIASDALVRALRMKGYAITVDYRVYSETEMARLYRDHDLLCSPHMGEGFGLCILEAMACGTPAVATAWSGVTDFFDASVGWPIETFDLEPAPRVLPATFPCDPCARMARVRSRDLATVLGNASAELRGEAGGARRAAGAARATTFTWGAAAEELPPSLPRRRNARSYDSFLPVPSRPGPQRHMQPQLPAVRAGDGSPRASAASARRVVGGERAGGVFRLLDSRRAVQLGRAVVEPPVR